MRPGDRMVRSEDTTRLASLVASIAWNAERVVQAVVAALASRNGVRHDYGTDQELSESGKVNQPLFVARPATRILYVRPT